jgi:uncharacterized protein YjdB
LKTLTDRCDGGSGVRQLLSCRRAVGLALALGLGACVQHNPDPTCAWQRAVAVTVSPPSLKLARGDTARVTASFVRRRSGSGCAPRAFGFAWYSTDTTVATVDGSGLVVARDTGAATIVVTTCDGPTGTAGVEVHP